MRRKTTAVGVAICAAALWATLEYGYAAPAATSGGLNIGVVSVRAVISKSQHQNDYRSSILKRQPQLQAQLDSRAKAVNAAEDELKTMVAGTDDYLKQLRVVLDKRAAYDSEKEFLTQQRSLEDKEWMEKLYQATLRITNEVAQERGLALVLERTEPTFPISADELMATFGTHKVLYAAGCQDLTSEVLKRLDADNSLKP